MYTGLLSNEKELFIGTHNNMDESQKHAKQKNPGIKDNRQN